MAETLPASHVALSGLGLIVVLAVLTWLASLLRRDVSLVDRTWGIFIAGAAGVYAALFPGPTERGLWMGVLVIAWALRLSIFITWRNWGHGEDRRYQEIRARNQPNFGLKSLYLIFALQALLAWTVSAPFFVGMAAAAPLGWLDGVGIALAAFGIVFEAIGDAQMSRFKADPANKGQVMDRGVWRFTRHPNYFGETCVWWGFWLMALAGAGWAGAWTVVSPILMTVLLLKVSGVSLLEKDITERRPAYRDYIARTNAFIPGWPRRKGIGVMKAALLRPMLGLTLAAAGAAHAAAPAAGEWNFRALLDGKPIGQHRFSVSAEGDERKVVSEANFAVKFLGITAYRYRHKATEQWRGDCLTALTATTDDDGKANKVRAEPAGEGLSVSDGAAAQTLPGCVMSFAYWNPAIQTQSRLLNAQTGKVEAVQVSRVGSGTVEVRGQPVAATQIRITGLPSPIDVWYSPQGEWIGLDSIVAGGRKLSYRLP